LMDSPDPVLVVFEPDGTIRSVGSSITDLTGKMPQEYIGRTVIDQVHPADADLVTQRSAWLLDQGDGARTRLRFRLRSGSDSWRWVEILGTNAASTPDLGAVVASLRDIHDDQSLMEEVRTAEREAAEGASDTREDSLRMLLSISADAVLVFDDDFNLVWSSPGLAAATGWSSDQLESVDPVDMVHADDLPAMLAGLSALQGEAAPADSSITIRLRRGDGYWRWTDVVGRDLRDYPAIGGVALAFPDADDRVRAAERVRASERRHRALVRHSDDGVMVCDAQGAITYASDAMTSLVGWSPDEATGVVMGTGLAEPHRSTVLDAFDLVKNEPGRVATIQYECQ
jgi:PAS domain S-box-containing protein